MKQLDHKEYLLKELKDPEYAKGYLNASYEAGLKAENMKGMNLAIRNVCEANGIENKIQLDN